MAIHPRFNKLITALRTAVENGEGILDKEATSYNDCFDAFRLSLMFLALEKVLDFLETESRISQIRDMHIYLGTIKGNNESKNQFVGTFDSDFIYFTCYSNHVC